MVDGLGVLDVDPYFREINDPLEELYQDLVHRLFEPYGSNIADPDRGVGLFGRLSGVVDVAALSRDIDTDFKKDDRVLGTSVDIKPLGDGFYELDIQVEVSEGSLGIKLEVNADGTVRKAGS